MYNGIGLTTPRGSGTNGHVQRNWAFVRAGKKDNSNFSTEEDIKKSEARLNRPPNKDILDHDRKRKIEVKCIEFEEILEKQGRSADEIKKKVDSYREKLLNQTKSDLPKDEFGRISVRETHQLAEAQLEKNSRLREAFNIPQYFVDGSSFDSDRKGKEDLLKSAALQKELELQRETLAAATKMATASNTEDKRRYGIVRTPSKDRDDAAPEKDHYTSSKSEKKKKRKRARDSSSASPERKKDKKKKSKKSKKESKKKSRKRKASEASSNDVDSEANGQVNSKKSRKKSKKEKRKAEKRSKKQDLPDAKERNSSTKSERHHSSTNRDSSCHDIPLDKTDLQHDRKRCDEPSQATKRQRRSRSAHTPDSKYIRRSRSHSNSYKRHDGEDPRRRSHSDRREQIRRSSRERDNERDSRSSKYDRQRQESEDRRYNERIQRQQQVHDRERKRERSQQRMRQSTKRDRSSERQRQRSKDTRDSRELSSRYRKRSPTPTLVSRERNRYNSRNRRCVTRSRSGTRSPATRRDGERHEISQTRNNERRSIKSKSVERNLKHGEKRQTENETRKRRSRSHSSKASLERKSKTRKQRSRSISPQKQHKSSGNKRDAYEKREKRTSSPTKAYASGGGGGSGSDGDIDVDVDKRNKVHVRSRITPACSRSPRKERQSETVKTRFSRTSSESSHSPTPPSDLDVRVKNESTTPTAPAPTKNESYETKKAIGDYKKPKIERNDEDRESSFSVKTNTPPPQLRRAAKSENDEEDASSSNSSELSYSPARKNPDRYREILHNSNSNTENRRKEKSPLQGTTPPTAQSAKHSSKDEEKLKSTVSRARQQQLNKSNHHAPAACLQMSSSESSDHDSDVDESIKNKESSALEEFQAPKRNVAIGEMALLQKLAMKAREKIKSREQQELQNVSERSQDNEKGGGLQVSEKLRRHGGVRNSLSEFLAANNVRTVNTMTAQGTTAIYPKPLEATANNTTDDDNDDDDNTDNAPLADANLLANGHDAKSPIANTMKTNATSTVVTNVAAAREQTPERERERNNSIRDHRTPPLHLRKPSNTSSYHRVNYNNSSVRSNLSIHNNVGGGGGIGTVIQPSAPYVSKYSLNNLTTNRNLATTTATTLAGSINAATGTFHRRIGNSNNNQYGNQTHFPGNSILNKHHGSNGNPILIGRREQHQRQYHHYRTNNNSHFPTNHHSLSTTNAFCSSSNNILLTNNSNSQINNSGSSNHHYHHGHNTHSNDIGGNSYQHHRNNHHREGGHHGHHSHHHHHGHSHGLGLASDPMLVATSLTTARHHHHHHNHHHHHHSLHYGIGGGGGGGGCGGGGGGGGVLNAGNASSNTVTVAHHTNFAAAAVAAAAASSSLTFHQSQQQQHQKQKIVIKPFKIHDPQPLANALADSALVDTIVSKVSTATVAAAAAAERERRSRSRPRRSRSNESRDRRAQNNEKEPNEEASNRSSSHSDYSRSSSSSSRSRSPSRSRSKSRSRSASQSSESSNSSKSSSQSSESSGSSRTGSRSPSIPRRRGSPSFLDRRRITSARKRPIPYHRKTPSDTSSFCSSCYSRCGSSPRTPASRSPAHISRSPSAAAF